MFLSNAQASVSLCVYVLHIWGHHLCSRDLQRLRNQSFPLWAPQVKPGHRQLALQPCGCRRSRERLGTAPQLRVQWEALGGSFLCRCVSDPPEPRSALSSSVIGSNASWRGREAVGPSDHRSPSPERKSAAWGLGIRSQHRGVPSPTELPGPVRTSSPVSLEHVSIHHSSRHCEKKLPVAWG